MPRGNDAAAAAQELAERYGETGNAEDLIRSNRVRRSRRLNKAGLVTVDEQASAKLNDDLASVEKQADLPEGAKVISAAVHGDTVVYVAELNNGMGPTIKDVLEYDRAKGKVGSGPDLEPDEAGEHATALADAQASAAQADAVAASEKAQAEARTEAEAEATEKAQKAKDDEKKAHRAAAKAAAKDADSDDDSE